MATEALGTPVCASTSWAAFSIFWRRFGGSEVWAWDNDETHVIARVKVNEHRRMPMNGRMNGSFEPNARHYSTRVEGRGSRPSRRGGAPRTPHTPPNRMGSRNGSARSPSVGPSRLADVQPSHCSHSRSEPNTSFASAGEKKWRQYWKHYRMILRQRPRPWAARWPQFTEDAGCPRAASNGAKDLL